MLINYNILEHAEHYELMTQESPLELLINKNFGKQNDFGWMD